MLESPTGLQTAFPHVVRISMQELLEGVCVPTMLWVHLVAGTSVADQLKALRLKLPRTPIVCMSDLPNDMEALAVFSVFAKGYCNTHAGAEVLHQIASVVAQGGIWIGESIMQKLLGVPSEMTSVDLVIETLWESQLSSREKQVAKAIAMGSINREIAEQMGITERTVKAHITAILEKLQLKSRMQLVLIVKDRQRLQN